MTHKEEMAYGLTEEEIAWGYRLFLGREPEARRLSPRNGVRSVQPRHSAEI